MIILFGNQKGGCGKSTATCNFASVLVTHEKDVLVVDADRQVTTSMWAAERKLSHSDLATVSVVQKYGEIDDTLTDLAGRYEYILVDASGNNSEELRSALVVCDMVIMPYRPSQPDLATAPVMSGLIKNASRVNPNLVAKAFINSNPSNSQGRDLQAARDALACYSNIVLLDTPIHDRRVYRDAMADGRGVIEMVEDKSHSSMTAKYEMMTLIEEVINETL